MVNISYDASGSLVSIYDVTAYDSSAGAEGVTVYNNGDMSWILTAAVLVMIMAAGIGYLYSGLLRRKNALSMLMLSMVVYSVGAIQWMFWGYSLAFGEGSMFIGNLKHFGLINVLDAPSVGSSKIPALLFCAYQSTFSSVTAVIVISGFAERARILPIMIFTFVWSTLVYDPVACWTWNATGWGFQKGVLDFAGGGPVHMTSGTATFVVSYYLGRRRGYGTAKLAYRPHSVSHVVLGTALLWFGWFGFNGGSELAMNLRSVQAALITNLAAAMGGLTWMMLDYYHTGKYSAVALCSGILAGLVGITPAAGYLGAPAALAVGFVTASACNFSTGLKVLLGVDDAVDGFALHGIGGFTGAILTGFFTDSRVAGFDGYTVIAGKFSLKIVYPSSQTHFHSSLVPGGWINKQYKQMGWQLASALAIITWTGVLTYIILFAIDHIPGLHFRATEDQEILGIDETECGETGYDFVFMRRDLESPEDVDALNNGASATLSRSSSGSNGKVPAEKAPLGTAKTLPIQTI
ncbi:BQ5605_C028g10492 [Microbotryum silenes-dioicae]|uniref:Ammonium transporter n=1 Tax=Microbotryum silenes-dioicae TaxID=796604 RepID=A0A2X0MIP4_9BASI|nr:BQ5605_C028g10492 [Microbotryum silenes-dioicae]